MDKFKNILSSSFVSSYKRTFGILFLLILAVAIPVTLGLIKQQQDIRQRASGYSCPAGSTQVGSTSDTNCPICEEETDGNGNGMLDRFSAAECSQGGTPSECTSPSECEGLPDSCTNLQTPQWTCITNSANTGNHCAHSCVAGSTPASCTVGSDCPDSNDCPAGTKFKTGAPQGCGSNGTCIALTCEPVNSTPTGAQCTVGSDCPDSNDCPAGTKFKTGAPQGCGSNGTCIALTCEPISADPTATTGPVDDPNSVGRGGAGKGAVTILATLSGTVSEGEKGVGSVSVKLTGTTGSRVSVNTSTSTGSDGKYAFKNVARGSYTVTITPPSCYTATTTSRSVAVDPVQETANFSLTKKTTAACGGSTSLSCGSVCNPADSNDCEKSSCKECKWDGIERKYTCQAATTATTSTSTSGSSSTGGFTGRGTTGGTKACGSSCTSNPTCAGASNGCTECVGTTPSSKTCQRPNNTGPTATAGPTCGKTCTSSATCTGATDGCTTCVTGTSGAKTCQPSNSTNPTNINLVVKARMPGVGSGVGDNNTPQHPTRSGTVFVYNTSNVEVKNGAINF